MGKLESNFYMETCAKIPNAKDWGKINDADYYPDDYHLNFLGKTCKELVEAINQPNGINIINSAYKIPLKPFIFYMTCILENISNGNISLIQHFSEFYFDNAIWTIKDKLHEQPDSSFNSFINPIHEILQKIATAEIPTIYEEDDWLEIRQECQELQTKILALNGINT